MAPRLVIPIILGALILARCVGIQAQPAAAAAGPSPSRDITGSIADARKQLQRVQEGSVRIAQAVVATRAGLTAVGKGSVPETAWTAAFDAEREAIGIRVFTADMESSLKEIEASARGARAIEAENAKLHQQLDSAQREARDAAAKSMARIAVAFAVAGGLAFLGGMALVIFTSAKIKGAGLAFLGIVMVVFSYAQMQHAEDFGTIGLWLVTAVLVAGTAWLVREIVMAGQGRKAATEMTKVIDRLKPYLTAAEFAEVFKGDPLYDPATYRYIESARTAAGKEPPCEPTPSSPYSSSQTPSGPSDGSPSSS